MGKFLDKTKDIAKTGIDNRKSKKSSKKNNSTINNNGSQVDNPFSNIKNIGDFKEIVTKDSKTLCKFLNDQCGAELNSEDISEVDRFIFEDMAMEIFKKFGEKPNLLLQGLQIIGDVFLSLLTCKWLSDAAKYTENSLRLNNNFTEINGKMKTDATEEINVLLHQGNSECTAKEVNIVRTPGDGNCMLWSIVTGIIEQNKATNANSTEVPAHIDHPTKEMYKFMHDKLIPHMRNLYFAAKIESAKNEHEENVQNLKTEITEKQNNVLSKSEIHTNSDKTLRTYYDRKDDEDKSGKDSTKRSRELSKNWDETNHELIKAKQDLKAAEKKLKAAEKEHKAEVKRLKNLATSSVWSLDSLLGNRRLDVGRFQTIADAIGKPIVFFLNENYTASYTYIPGVQPNFTGETGTASSLLMAKELKKTPPPIVVYCTKGHARMMTVSLIPKEGKSADDVTDADGFDLIDANDAE
jgi:hypothetical protein